MNSIAELSDSKIQTIIDYFSKNPNIELLNDQDDSIIDSKEEISDDQTIASEIVSAEVNISTAPIPLTHVSNFSDLVNTPVIPYDARAPYINVVLKEYPYLFLYNSGRFQDRYEFKNSGICPGCEKEHDKEELVGQIIDDSYNIKYLSSSREKEIKINASLKIEKSISITFNNYNDTAKGGETYYYDDETDDWSTPYEDKDRGYYLNLDTREIRRKETVVF